MSNDHWRTHEDFENDMLAVSDFYDGSTPRPRERPSEHERRTRSKISIYDDVPEEMEERTIRPGRGLPLTNKIPRRPGWGTRASLYLQNQITKEIREASTGVVFSNDVIENNLKSNFNQRSSVVENKNKSKMPDLRLTRSPTSDLSSKCSSPSISPLPSTSSGEESPAHLKQPQGTMVTNKINPASIYAQRGTVQGSTSKPPPIYEMLKGRNKKPAGNSKTNFQVEEKEKNINWFPSRDGQIFNIASKTDFPELK